MRLTADQCQAIRQEVDRIFGAGATVRLFGSRVNDQARGGDIDLYIEAEGSPGELMDRELKLRGRLQRRLGEQRIDVVVHGHGQPLRPIDQHARETGQSL